MASKKDIYYYDCLLIKNQPQVNVAEEYIAYVEKYELIPRFSHSERKQVLEMKTELNRLRMELKSPYEFLRNIHCNNKTPDGRVAYDSLTKYYDSQVWEVKFLNPTQLLKDYIEGLQLDIPIHRANREQLKRSKIYEPQEQLFSRRVSCNLFEFTLHARTGFKPHNDPGLTCHPKSEKPAFPEERYILYDANYKRLPKSTEGDRCDDNDASTSESKNVTQSAIYNTKRIEKFKGNFKDGTIQDFIYKHNY